MRLSLGISRRALRHPVSLLGAALLALPLAPAARSAALGAQATAPTTVAPPLAAGADTNDVAQYLQAGADLLKRNPQKAVAYFRWAAELDPQTPEAPYGERVALLLADRDRLLQYMRGNRRSREQPDIVRADSLQSLALARAPLFFRRYDRMLLTTYFEAAVRRSARNSGMSGEDESELAFEMNRYLSSTEAPAYLRAWLAYADGDFRRSAKLYQEALARARKWERGDLLAERARTFAHLGEADSAIAAFRASMAADSTRDEDRLVFALKSRAQMEHVLGALLLTRGDSAAAREAYGRALTQDLGYYPAHVALGTLAYETGDTAAARHELREAIQVAADEPALRYTYGLVLATSGSVAEGVDEVLRARQLAPRWAEPHLLLARMHDAASMPDEAVEHWRSFLARAPRSHPARAMAEQRLASVKP